VLLLAAGLTAGCSQTPAGLQEGDPKPPELYDPPAPAGDWWQPGVGTTFQVQFQGNIDLGIQADVYDLDLFDTEVGTIAAIHANGGHVLCYLSAGSWEDWRPDAGLFPEAVIGKDYEGWQGEKWLDIRQVDALAPILRARLDLCAAKGFDGVEPDNVQVYDNDSGFPITYEDQVTFALWLAGEAHARGLAIGLKNAPDMAAEVLAAFDFSVLEDCAVWGWCADLAPFVQAGKPVFAIEYTDSQHDFAAACEQAGRLGFDMILKHRGLDAFREACP
jgi:hypothetical protein